MKAAVYHKPKDITFDTWDEPKIQHPQDAVLKVTSTAICGSDLHIYNGLFPQVKNMVMGHEFMGVVEETGAEVKNLKKGDRVVVPFPVACGVCWFCNHGLPIHCENSNLQHYGPEGAITKEKGGGLFGYTDLYGGYDGGQAEYVRVPYADFGPRKVPEGVEDEKVLFLTDIFPTGYAGVDWANIKGGEVVAVFGCGPVGLMAQKAAWARGAARVIALDILDYRLAKAKQVCKSETINVKEDSAILRVRDMTYGRGADVCIDAVGMEVERSFLDKTAALLKMERGSIEAIRLACSAVRRGGFVSILGVYGYNYDNFPLSQIFDKGISVRTGQVPVQSYIDELMKWALEDKIKLDDIITHRLPLSEVSHAYEIFNKKTDDCVKVVLKP